MIISAEVGSGRWSDEGYSAALSCPAHADVRLGDLSPQIFSFNSPQGACDSCHGLGTTLEFDPELIVPDPNLSLRDGAVAAWRHQGKSLNALYMRMRQEFCERFGVAENSPFLAPFEEFARPLRIEPGATARIRVGVHPQGPGSYTATLELHSPQAAVGPATVELRARAP